MGYLTNGGHIEVAQGKPDIQRQNRLASTIGATTT
jgi:hypothetical protein